MDLCLDDVKTLSLEGNEVIKLEYNNSVIWEKQKETELVLLTKTGFKGDSIIVGLRDVYGNHLANKIVNIRIRSKSSSGDINYDCTTDNDGKASLAISLAVGNAFTNDLEVIASFDGDSNYKASTVTGDYAYEVYNTVSKICQTASADTTSSSQSSYGGWYNVAQLKGTGLASYHVTGNTGSYPNPSAVWCSNFGFNIPSNVEIASLQVEYSQKASNITSNNGISVGAATIKCWYNNTQYAHCTGSSLTATSTKYTNTFTIDKSITPAIVNNSNFKVSVDYPANTKGNSGYVYLGGVTLIVKYKAGRVMVEW